MFKALKCTAVLVLALAASSAARAEVAEITVAQQYGVSFLPLMVMEKQGLAEDFAKQEGVQGLKVNWVKFAGPSTMNDGLISGAVQFAAQGAPSMITLWDRTRGRIGVMGMAAMTTYPLYLVTRNPALKSLTDLTAADKVAVPSVKISTQAIMLQMAAAEIFGEKEFAKFDPATISLSHPDGLLALKNNTAGVTAHFTSSPFYEQEMKMPGAHLVTTNYEILGGPATAVVLTTTSKFRESNPKVYKAFLAGLTKAIEIINADKRAAAQLYIDMANDKLTSVDELVQMISDKDYRYTLKPEKVLKTAQFMAKIGSIKETPKSIDDLFFPEVSGLKGD